MSYRLADLQARRAAVEETLGRVSLELKREAQRAKDAKKRLAKQWLLAGPIRRRVLISYRLAESPQPAVKYLKHVGKRHDWPPKSDAELTSLVNDCFQNAGRDEIVAMVSPEDPSCDKAALQEAVGYVEGWRLVKWTEELNSAKGVAPSNEMVLQRAEHNRLQLPEDLRFVTRGTIAENKARKWVRRWRLRWGGRLAKPVCREPLTLDEMRAKAACRGGGTCPGERALVYMRGEGGGWQNRREGLQKRVRFCGRQAGRISRTSYSTCYGRVGLWGRQAAPKTTPKFLTESACSSDQPPPLSGARSVAVVAILPRAASAWEEPSED